MIQEVFNNNPKKSFNYKQMSAAIGLNKKSGRQLVEVLLFEMIESGVLSEIAAGRFKMLSRGSHIIGVVDMTASGAAYIVPEDGGDDVFVSQTNLNSALHGDTVKVLQYARKRRRDRKSVV